MSAVSAGRGAACALLGLAAVLAVAGGCSAWNGASRLAARGDDAASAEAASAAFIRAYGSFDYRSAELYAPRLAALAAGDLRRALQNASVDPAASRERRAGAVVVESAEVTSLQGDTAVVAVRSVQQWSRTDPGSGEEIREVATRHASLRLVRSDGSWLVAELNVTGGGRAGARGAR